MDEISKRKAWHLYWIFITVYIVLGWAFVVGYYTWALSDPSRNPMHRDLRFSKNAER